MNGFQTIYGARVIEISEKYTLIRKQIRFYKSKKKRIIKKILSNESNFQTSRNTFKKGDTIFADKITIDSLKKHLCGDNTEK